MTLFRSNLFKRAISAAILVPAFLSVVWAGGLAFNSLMLLCILWCGYEWLMMINPSGQKVVWVTVLFSLALSWGVALQNDVSIALIVCLSISLVLMAAFRLMRIRKPVLLSLGVSYIGSAGLGMMALRQIETYGFGLTVFLCSVVWLTDTGAFFFGKTIKGARLAPDISPGKTWAGFVGGILAAIFVGGLISALFRPAQPIMVLTISACLSLAAQCGDLFESWVKRQAGVKNSGELIPGHGGLLDRVDGLVMAVLMFWAAIWAFNHDFSWWVR